MVEDDLADVDLLPGLDHRISRTSKKSRGSSTPRNPAAAGPGGKSPGSSPAATAIATTPRSRSPIPAPQRAMNRWNGAPPPPPRPPPRTGRIRPIWADPGPPRDRHPPEEPEPHSRAPAGDEPLERGPPASTSSPSPHGPHQAERPELDRGRERRERRRGDRGLRPGNPGRCARDDRAPQECRGRGGGHGAF